MDREQESYQKIAESARETEWGPGMEPIGLTDEVEDET